ncbi:MAG: DUF3368 domain-containing protein [Acidobacteriota bacterium]
MKIESVVINASLLIVLFKSGMGDLLPQLFREIYIPEAVWQEIIAGGAQDTAAQNLSSATWAQRVTVSVTNPIITAWNLGAGESEVLSYALENPGYRAMVDDAAARACAKTLNIPTLGTGGAIVLAKNRNLIDSVTQALEALQNSGLWLSENIIRLLKQQADE